MGWGEVSARPEAPPGRVVVAGLVEAHRPGALALPAREQRPVNALVWWVVAIPAVFTVVIVLFTWSLCVVAGRADDRMGDDIARKAAADEASLRMVAGVAHLAAEIGVAGSPPSPATPKDGQP